ncbi:DUF2141 domain-containing protein [Croceicoccus mobilis]|nr:DUF2141 domain-containing protein [Croceicoccus mobilis]
MKHVIRMAAVLSLAALAAPAPADDATSTATAGPVAASTARLVDISVSVTDLRSRKGQILACLAPTRTSFPDCEKGNGRALVIPADHAGHFEFRGVPAGQYAIALLHDENGNGKIDKALMIPREGFGFSRNARLRMGPPAFKDAAFTADQPDTSQSIRMRYML